MNEEDLEKASRAGGCVFALLGLVLVVTGVAIVVDGFALAPKIDSAHRCFPGEDGRCFTSRTGVVRSVEHDRVVVCGEEGGCDEHTLAADSNPAVGARVRVERWNGEDVAIVDLSTEHRYRTMWWPRAWDPYGIGIAVAGAFLAGIVVFANRHER